MAKETTNAENNTKNNDFVGNVNYLFIKDTSTSHDDDNKVSGIRKSICLS